MKTRIIIISIFLFLHIVLFSQRNIPPQKPTLIVQITVEQMRYDYITRFWNLLGDNGIKKLSLYGAVCKNAQINYMFTQSAPGHASISTGAIPADHGIIGDKWYDRLKNEEVDCVEDLSEKTIGSRGQTYNSSGRKILGTTIFDELKFIDFKSKTISISSDNTSAVLSAGHISDGVYWLDEGNGTFVTSTYYTKNLLGWVKDFNNKNMANIYLERRWITEYPTYQYLECLPDNNPYEIGFGGKIEFDYNIPSLASRTKKYEILKSTPFANSIVKDFAIQSIVGEELGKDNHTDILNISFAATKHIGKLFGSMSVEMADAFVKLDKDIEFLINFVEKEIGRENVLFIFTSNQGAAHIPKYLQDMNIPSGQFKYSQAVYLLKSYLNALYGEGDWVKYYYKHQMYLNHILIENSKISLEEIQQKSADFLIQLSGVANVITASTLKKTNFKNPILCKMQNSYSQKLSGDLLINLQPGWVEQSIDEVSISNSAYSYDTHIPLIWYGWKIERQAISEPVFITDIAPTIANFLNISKPTLCTGNVIYQLIK